MRVRESMALVMLLVAAAGLSGCARRVPVAELARRGAEVGVRAELRSGERIEGRLASLSDETLVVDVVYRPGPDVEIVGSTDRLSVVSAGETVAGEIVSVEGRGRDRRVTLRRTIEAAQVARATFHRSAREATLAPVVSVLAGPLIGAALALLL